MQASPSPNPGARAGFAGGGGSRPAVFALRTDPLHLGGVAVIAAR